jgi:DNA-binding helix-hairpin-helix protein with protein kinase domain
MPYYSTRDNQGHLIIIDLDDPLGISEPPEDDETYLEENYSQDEGGKTMSKIVFLGNGDKKIRHALTPLESNMKTGGQGDVYFPDKKTCFKVLHDPDTFRNQLDIIARIIYNCGQLYEEVRSVSAVPLELVWDENAKKVIGYSMERLIGWSGMHEIQTETDSESMGMDLRSTGLLLAELCKAVRLIHSQGFVIGDFNPSNVMFKRENNQLSVKVIDVDSWSIYRKNDLGIEFASDVLDTGVIYYPDVIQADRAEPPNPWPNFTRNHDWWAFAYISWMVLAKYDPFSTGAVSDADKEDRILNGLTANNAATVRLRPDCGPAAQALGPKLRFYLDRCLKQKVRRPFPTKLLEDFANNLCQCKKCGFTAQASAILCPQCAHFL